MADVNRLNELLLERKTFWKEKHFGKKMTVLEYSLVQILFVFEYMTTLFYEREGDGYAEF